MKNLLLAILLMASSACLAQTALSTKATGPVKTDSSDKIYSSVEQMPQFPGGDRKLSNFLQKNIHYPSEARTKNIQGIVYVSFVVLNDGTLSDIKVVHGVEGGISEEAVRVVKMMPKWVPGSKDGKTVNVLINLPVSFQLTQQP